ncbi:hypothetical protein TKK_0001085 [Trichogramma kaykai]
MNSVLRKKIDVIEIPELTSRLNILCLNDDCLIEIFMNLTIKDRFMIKRVCKRWHDVVEMSWRNIKKINGLSQLWGINWSRKTDKKILRIFQDTLLQCAFYLTDIDFTDMYIDDDILTIIVQVCPNLMSIDTGGLLVTQNALTNLVKNCHKVEKLCLSFFADGCHETHLSQFLIHAKKLKYFKIVCNFDVTGSFLYNLSTTTISTLIVKDCKNLMISNVCNVISKFLKLQTFVLILTNFHYESSTFGYQKKITYLSEEIITLQVPNIKEIDVNIYYRLKYLQTLNISGTNVTDDILISISMNCKELRHVFLNDCFAVTDSGLGAISSVPKLQTLSYDNLKKITGRSITYIPYLRKMSCYGCSNLVDDGLCEILRTNENLEFIDVGQCHNLSVNFIKFASEAVRLRTNGVSLIIYISKSMRHIIKLNYSISPSLHVMIPVDDLKHQYT